MQHGNIFLETLRSKARFLSAGAEKVSRTNPELTAWLLDPLATWAEKAYGDRVFEDAIKGYSEYCINVVKAQRTYEQTGIFINQNLSQIKAEVYEKEGYMSPYMWAAILIYAFWPSMITHIRLFRDEFLAQLPQGANMLELASGHGVLSLLAANQRQDIFVEGFDISPPAVAISQKLLLAAQWQSRVKFAVKDVLDLETAGEKGQYQGVIAAMLAEHLLEPHRLFSTIAYHLAPGGTAFFSTALESAQPDHIYEFHHESEPIKMAESAGLRVTRLVSDASTSNSTDRFQPRAVAMILAHR